MGRQAMKALQSLSSRIAAEGAEGGGDGGGAEPETPAEDDFEAQLQMALELSMKEAQVAAARGRWPLARGGSTRTVARC